MCGQRTSGLDSGTNWTVGLVLDPATVAASQPTASKRARAGGRRWRGKAERGCPHHRHLTACTGIVSVHACPVVSVPCRGARPCGKAAVVMPRRAVEAGDAGQGTPLPRALQGHTHGAVHCARTGRASRLPAANSLPLWVGLGQYIYSSFHWGSYAHEPLSCSNMASSAC